MGTKVYMTVLNSEKYLPGALALNEKIKKYCNHDLIMLLDNNVASQYYRLLKNLNVLYIVDDNFTIEFDNHEMQYWGKTLFKLKVFAHKEFDKIVLIDSDMLVVGNLDSLFEKEDMSAVPDKKMLCDGTGVEGFNSGLMVIEPAKHNMEDIFNCCDKIKRKIFGDQDILNEYIPNWGGQREKHLSNIYNMFGLRLQLCDDLKNIKIIHYIGPVKPWMWTKWEFLILYVKLFRSSDKRKNLKYLSEYYKCTVQYKKLCDTY